MNHHPDCDGYVDVHTPEVRRHPEHPGIMRRLECRDADCGNVGTWVGKGVSDASLRRLGLACRPDTIPCDGRCASWPV